jgi:hypothetical protein
MFGGVGKNNKIWCCLEHLDLLFTTLRFVFFTLTYVFTLTTDVSFLEELWHAIRTHVHDHFTNFLDFLFYLLF